MNSEIVFYLLDWLPSLVVFLVGFISVFLTGRRFSRLDSSIRCLSVPSESAPSESASSESAPSESAPSESALSESASVFTSFSDDELLRYYRGNSLILHDLVDELIRRGLFNDR